LPRLTIVASSGTDFSGTSSTLVRSFISRGEHSLLRRLLLKGI
jgi:hypothetical protein